MDSIWVIQISMTLKRTNVRPKKSMTMLYMTNVCSCRATRNGGEVASRWGFEVSLTLRDAGVLDHVKLNNALSIESCSEWRWGYLASLSKGKCLQLGQTELTMLLHWPQSIIFSITYSIPPSQVASAITPRLTAEVFQTLQLVEGLKTQCHVSMYIQAIVLKMPHLSVKEYIFFISKIHM